MNPIRGLAEAEALLQRYEQEPIHVRQVARLAGQLFTGLASWHGRDQLAGHYLHLAALLHDIGWSQSPDGSGHHKHSARLILSHSWSELAPEEVSIVATTARYHRKALPSEKHAGYHALSPAQRQLVCELAGILRVADALDRTHAQVVDSVAVQIKDETIELQVESRGSCLEERRMVMRKCDLLEIASQRKVRFA